MLAGEHVVKCLLESLATLGFWPERFVVINNTIRIASGLPSVTDYMAGNFFVRINAYVDWPHDRVQRQIIFYLVILLLAEILCDLQRHDPTVAIATKDCLV